MKEYYTGDLFSDLLEDDSLFKNGRNYTKLNGKFFLKLEDNRSWCPSRQMRGDAEYELTKLINKKDNFHKTLNFTAIDFETATRSDRMPCQIGVVVVRNGEIVKRICRLIQPPYNKYSNACISVHGITPNQTIDEPCFASVWKDIEGYFINSFIVAHNAAFDIDVLQRALEYYGIELPNISGCACTMDINNKLSLAKACDLYGINLQAHHDALCDAECCANLYLCYTQGIECLKDEEKGEKELDIATNSGSLLGGIRIYLMGNFPNKALFKSRISKAGGITNKGLSKSTRVIVEGTNPNKNDLLKIETLNHDGFKIPIIQELDINDILLGINKNFHFPEVTKNVNITYDFIFNPIHPKIISISKDGITHRLGNKEIFVYKCDAKFLILGQLIGNIGGSVTNVFDPNNTNFIMINDLTLEKLKLGEKDEEIILIASIYNTSKSDKFTYKFIIENEFLNFIEVRSQKVNDDNTLRLLEKYRAIQ